VGDGAVNEITDNQAWERPISIAFASSNKVIDLSRAIPCNRLGGWEWGERECMLERLVRFPSSSPRRQTI
jgi:hypothetical protein